MGEDQFPVLPAAVSRDAAALRLGALPSLVAGPPRALVARFVVALADPELAEPGAAGGPVEAVEEIGRWHGESAGQLDQRVDPGDAFSSLQLPDGGSMQRSPHAQLLLREVSSFATARKVLAEATGDVHAGILLSGGAQVYRLDVHH